MLPDTTGNETEDEVEKDILTEERTYYPKGRLRTVKRYKYGIRHGVSEAYATDGQLYRKSEFEDGRQIMFDGFYFSIKEGK